MRKAIVVDLDGTLLDTNTFKEYISFVGRKALRKGRIDLCLLLAVCVAMRKLRLVTHEKMKKAILCGTTTLFNDSLRNDFVNQLLTKANANVLSTLSEYKNRGYFALLSTAAPSRYAESIAKHCGFDGFVCTPEPINSDWHENVRENKKENTLRYMKSHDCVIAVLMTDHWDDIPLLKVEKEKNILVKPSAHSLDMINAEGLQYDIL